MGLVLCSKKQEKNKKKTKSKIYVLLRARARTLVRCAVCAHAHPRVEGSLSRTEQHQLFVQTMEGGG